MNGLKVIDELDEYRMSLERMEVLKEQVAGDMLVRMNKLRDENRTPILVLDTYIDTVCENYTREDGKPLNRKNAFDIIRNAIQINSELVKTDGVVISFKVRLLTCNLGHRYSELLKTCPDPMHKLVKP